MISGAALAIMLLAGCRQKMADQPRYDPLQESAFYADLLSARPLPDGVIARDFVEKDELLDLGLAGDRPADRIPYPITIELLRRGRERYDIYCTPCHDFIGTGNGMAVQRGFRTRPPSFHTDELRAAPPGRFFEAITNGFGAMPPYAGQVAPQDRWAVIAYIRALQLSQWASPDDIPADVLRELQ
jgi:mono/diheme cytochrome c family protein